MDMAEDMAMDTDTGTKQKKNKIIFLVYIPSIIIEGIYTIFMN